MPPRRGERDAERRRLCFLAHHVAIAMSRDIPVTLETVDGPVSGRVERFPRDPNLAKTSALSNLRVEIGERSVPLIHVRSLRRA